MLKKKWADEEKKISGGNGFIAKIKNDRIYFFTLEFFFFFLVSTKSVENLRPDEKHWLKLLIAK